VGTIDGIGEGTDINGDPVIIVTYTDTETVPPAWWSSVSDAVAWGSLPRIR
jgi:hypothetical protein